MLFLICICFLTGTPPLTGSGTVLVVVQDVNDHSPEFEMQAYSASVRENMPPGTPVLQPTAVDKDADLNAKIRWDKLAGSGTGARQFSHGRRKMPELSNATLQAV